MGPDQADCNSARTCWGRKLAWASIACEESCKIMCRVAVVDSWAMSASRTRESAAAVLSPNTPTLGWMWAKALM